MFEPPAALVVLTIAIALLALLDVAAMRVGVDSRPSIRDDHRR